jgi:hypothetical protein
LREVRAPLLAGGLLLAAVYLVLFDAADDVLAESEVSDSLQSLYELLGRNGLLAAAAVLAYLVGTVFTRLMTLAMRSFTFRLVPLVAVPEFIQSTAPRPRLLHFCRPFSRPSIRRILPLCEQRQCRAEDVLTDIIVSGGKRLLSTHRDLYMEYDRLRSEAELRLAVVLPALVLAVVVAFQVPATLATEVASIAVVGLIALLVLIDAMTLTRHANSMYAHAVADGVITTPTLDAPNGPPAQAGDDDA